MADIEGTECTSRDDKLLFLKAAESKVTHDDSERGDLATVDTEVSPSNIDTTQLPGGRHMGRCLHEAIELCHLDEVAKTDEETWISKAENLQLFERIFRRHGIDIQYRALAQQIVYRTLTRPFTFEHVGTLPPLCSVDGRREVEFLFPLPEVEHPLLDVDSDEDRYWELDRGLVKGFIDFVFMHEGKLYWVDWKSDVLKSYGPEHIQSHVDGHYDLQVALYTLSCCESWGSKSKGLRKSIWWPRIYLSGVFVMRHVQLMVCILNAI